MLTREKKRRRKRKRQRVVVKGKKEEKKVQITIDYLRISGAATRLRQLQIRKR
jgi:hypothetical protein